MVSNIQPILAQFTNSLNISMQKKNFRDLDVEITRLWSQVQKMADADKGIIREHIIKTVQLGITSFPIEAFLTIINMSIRPFNNLKELEEPFWAELRRRDGEKDVNLGRPVFAGTAALNNTIQASQKLDLEGLEKKVNELKPRIDTNSNKGEQVRISISALDKKVDEESDKINKTVNSAQQVVVTIEKNNDNEGGNSWDVIKKTAVGGVVLAAVVGVYKLYSSWNK